MFGMKNDRLARRDWLKLTGAGLLGTSSCGWFDAMANRAVAAGNGKPKKSCILLWMSGGPAQTDTFDLKPGTASEGEFKPIETNLPGLEICEHLPQMAKQADKLAVLRSMSTMEADHHRATYYLRTGYKQMGGTSHPSLGSIASMELGDAESDMPNFIWTGNRVVGSGFLEASHAPFVLGGSVKRPPENVKASDPAGFDAKFSALDQLEQAFLDRNLGAPAVNAHRTAYRQAAKIMRSERMKAFDFNSEPEKIRERYGKTEFGSQCLLARRLVEVGVPFVGIGMQADWDTHIDNWNRMRPCMPEMDTAWSALLEDLDQRGMLDDVLVVWMGEFGRDPRINKSTKPGREHYARAWTTVLAGGGIKAGQVIGSTDHLGMEVTDRPIGTADYMATLCQILGIDYTKKNVTPDGRPIRIAGEGAKIVEQLL